MSKRDTAGKVVELKQQTKLLFFSLFLHLIIKKIQYNNLKDKKPVKKFLLSLCFLLALSPAARSSIYLFEQFDDTFLLNGWSVVGTDMNIGIATSSDNGNHWHEGWVQNFGATGNHEISQEIATEDMDDLEVAVWIQNYDTKKVYNSHFLFETPNHPFAPEQLTLTKEGNTFTAQWNAPAGNAPTGYNIWMNETLVDENSNYIQGFISKKNMMYNALGQLVKAFGDAQQIPLNDLPDGLYHLVATDEKGTIRNTKVIINH